MWEKYNVKINTKQEKCSVPLQHNVVRKEGYASFGIHERKIMKSKFVFQFDTTVFFPFGLKTKGKRREKKKTRKGKIMVHEEKPDLENPMCSIVCQNSRNPYRYLVVMGSVLVCLRTTSHFIHPFVHIVDI